MNKSTEVKYVPKNDYLKNLQNLGESIKSTVNEMLDSIDNGGDYQEKYNLQITCNGHTGYIELHADAYDRIMGMIETEIAEYIALHDFELESELDEIERIADSDIERAIKLQNKYLDDMLAGVE